MASFDDPTPCPQPRRGVLEPSRLSVLGSVDTSITLNDAPKAPTLHDAKPRRPRKRQSVGWDPTVDIYEDTFALQQSAPAPIEPNAAMNKVTRASMADSKSRRSSTMFTQPAQRLALGTSHSAANEGSPKKRRLSSVVEQRAFETNPNSIAPANGIQGRPSILHKEARRRTIYIPNDTTVLTIHPGASLESQVGKISKPRKSDVFLELATVTGDRFPVQPRHRQQDEGVPKRNRPRPSLIAAPRRVPLQTSARQVQPQAIHVNLPGQGGGKENEPPGGAVKPKRLGKRASLILPDKCALKPPIMLAPVGEDTELRLDSTPEKRLEPEPKSKGNLASPRLNHAVSRQSVEVVPPPRRLSVSQSTLHMGTDARRGSLLVANSLKPHTEPQARVPASLSVPNVRVPSGSSLQRYASLVEDVAHPELYEENWLSHQEQSITQLVNSLFEKVGGKHSPLGCHKSVRQQLLNSYHSSDNVLLHKRLHASLRFGALSIPPESLAQVARFKDDFGQRQRFLDLWTKTYNLESLQVAAEIVIGRRRVSSPRNSSDGKVGEASPPRDRAKSTSKFLQTSLVQNQDLATRTSINVAAPGSPSALMASRGSNISVAHCWRRTALRSLMIIHLLDNAQRLGLLEGRNLFQSSSPYKSSLAVLHGLCRLLIPSVGDVSRVVGHLGYHVEHMQYPLEEFTYSITNLATDLRDGVRLTRLVECLLYPPGSLDLQKDGLTVTLAGGDILMSCLEYNGNQGASWPLSQHLKYPCVSRPQRIHNVEIALAAFSSIHDFKDCLLKDVTAADIVDGHREKTVKLLWSLVSRWGLSMLVGFDLVKHEIVRLRHHQNRRALPSIISNDSWDDEAELPYLSQSEQQSRLLLSWASTIGSLNGATVSNLTTSFADGTAYKAIAKEYSSLLPSMSSAVGKRASDPESLLFSLGCSRSFLSLFTQPSTCPTKTTTISLLAFLASRILPIAVPQQAALVIQHAHRSRQQRWETKKHVVAKGLAQECAAVVQAQQKLVGAVVILQRWWRRCVEDRRAGRRRWV